MNDQHAPPQDPQTRSQTGMQATEQSKTNAGKASPEQVLAELKASVRSVILSTIGNDQQPHSGYTPFVFNGKELIIFVSQLSLHTRDLLANGKASAMLIADESASTQLFARTRVSYQCEALAVLSDHADYDSLLDQLQAAHGKMVGLLRQLPDFVLFRLVPVSGQFVMGFGQAYHLKGADLDQFEHATSA